MRHDSAVRDVGAAPRHDYYQQHTVDRAYSNFTFCRARGDEPLADFPQAMLADLCAFLEVDLRRMPDQVQHRNVTLWARSRAVGWLLRCSGMFKALLPRRLHRAVGVRLRNWNRVKPPPLDPMLRSELTESYRSHILYLHDMIGRDLSHWLAA